MIVVVALGGNALVENEKKPSIESQFSVVKKTISKLLPLIKKHKVVITHGNGFQAGNSLIRVEEAKGKAYTLPLDVCGAQTQAEIGYLIEQSLNNQLKDRNVAVVLTQVLVSKKDPMFKNPTKFIGPFYNKKQAQKLIKSGLNIREDSGRGYRRVVPSPMPLKIIEFETIKKLIKSKTIVIAVGGGGIPVVLENNKLKGVEAVIDKDLASAVLAKEIKAKVMLILTGVSKVAINYNKTNQKWLNKITLKQAEEYFKQGHFPPGSMGPKIEAAISFLKNGGKKVIITSPELAEKALKGKAGTVIVKR